jgi:hypothetical protein
MSNQETQQTSQDVWGRVRVKSFTFYKLDKSWILGDVMDEVVKRLDYVVHEKWDELYSPGYNEEVLDEIEKILQDVDEEELKSNNILFDYKIVHRQSVLGFEFYDFLLRLIDIESLKDWAEKPVVDGVGFDILVGRYRTMVPPNKQELYTSVKYAQHAVWIPKSIVKKCAQDSKPNLCMGIIAQLIANKIGFRVPTSREKTWEVWI